MTTALLTTKLYIPPVRPDPSTGLRASLVPRPRLVERLNQGLLRQSGGFVRKLTLISAPAGFGKTTLVGAWIHQHDGLRAAWVSLDEGDNDPQRFWAYVVAALQTVDPALGQAQSSALQSPQPPPLEAIATALINDLAEKSNGELSPLILVLDDYHTITTSKIHRSLDFFLNHLPQGFHLVITTREDPPLSLPRLRGRGQLMEIRAADLRFTPEEATQLFNAVMDLDLPMEDVTILSDRTEGWAVGLQMAALSLQRETQSDRHKFVRAFAGDNRLVADYLADEVLARQPPYLRTFLLQTSILERLCGPLCDALTGGDKSQSILRDLEQANLFIVPLDHRRHWYRYHLLFADLLRARLKEECTPEAIAALHHRASAWYAREGFWADAIAHALQAADDERAAGLITQSALPALLRGEFVLVERWLDALPEDTVRARPILCIARAWCILPTSTNQTKQWIQEAEASLADSLESHIRTLVIAHAAALRVSIARANEAPPSRIVALCQEALNKIPESDTELHALVAFWMGHASLDLGDDAAADQAFELVTRVQRDSENHTITLVMAGLRAWTHLNRGHLHTAAALCREALQTIIEPAERAGQRLPMACYIYIVLGQVCWQWNDREQAASYLEHGIELGELTLIERPILIEGYCALARLRSVEGDFEAALALMDKAEQTMRLTQGEAGFIPAHRVGIWLRQARAGQARGEDDTHSLDRAIAWADEHFLQQSEADSAASQWPLTLSGPPTLSSFVQVRIAQYHTYGTPDLEPLLAMLDEQIQRAEGSERIAWQIEVLILKALVLQAQGQSTRAVEPLERALTIAKPERFVRMFLDHGAPIRVLLKQVARENPAVREYACDLLITLEAEEGGEQPTQKPLTSAEATVLVEPLTPRELEVLAVIATGASNPEIARKLHITVNTVKRHITNIFGKLGVSRRTQAVARGRELELIDSVDHEML
jgi:LuxR family maltose regulon positive regulatory protein